MQIDLPTLASLQGITSPDGRYAMLHLKARNGSDLRVGLDADVLGRMINFISSIAVEMASRATTPPIVDRPSTKPMPVSEIAVAAGRTAEESILNIQVGPTTFSFAVERSMLEEVCAGGHARTARPNGVVPN